MPLILVTGNKGGGKTCFATSMAKLAFDKGRNVFSNYHLAFDYSPINVSKMIENPDSVRDAVILIDEAHITLDSRRAGSGKNIMFSYLMTQSRKRRISLILTTQQASAVDVRIRRNMDELYLCEAMKASKGVVRRATTHEVEHANVDLILVTMTDYGQLIQKKMLWNPKSTFELYDSDEFIPMS